MPPRFLLHFQGAILWILPNTFFHSSTGLSPFIVFLSRKLRVRKKAGKESPQHHISLLLLIKIQFELYRFRSLLLTASHLIFFPTGTQMFHFPAFPNLKRFRGEVSFGNL